ncbi:hypothetical protein SAMN05444007_108245 [Cribrihabitans marinus]|uniref:Uncharacterized protein n=1 Tax=Cribrihabitans marinus TaxID=1227549 RepID=A0A1H7CPI5_9RHOB|nr:hypothetical protein [Cribrihabitans marinus]GGH36278.1 hypothetical protein GCM10010973_30150 [Cribrihabitans marinus]SEJ91511.1 hypothetical protein SAMN05444007_108245 [Cribrihabitans marinus]
MTAEQFVQDDPGDAARANRDDSLTDQGLRCRNDGLFIANYPLPVFHGTRWAGGEHVPLFRSLSGAFAPVSSLTLGRVAARGRILPWALIERGLSND